MGLPDVSHLYVDRRSWPRGVKPFDDGLTCTIRRDETGMYHLQLFRAGRWVNWNYYDARNVSAAALTHWGARRTARRLLRAYRAGESYTSTEKETIR